MKVKTGRTSFFLTLEFLGIFAGIWAFIAFFKNVIFKFQYHVLGSESEKTLILKEILSSFLWTGILLFVFLFVFFIRKVKANENLKDLGFIKHRSFAKDIWYGIVGFALIYVITLPFFIAILPERAKISKGSLIANLAENEYTPSTILAAVFFMAFATLVCAFWEEIYWRGYMQNVLSRKLAPAAGFLASMIFFTLSHYITRPYSVTITVLVLVSGTIFGLIFYATGSLWVALIIHTLGNLSGDYPAYLYIKGSVTRSYVFAGALGGLSLIICILGRKEIKHLLKKTQELFKSSGWKMSFLGIILGCIALFYVWLQDLLKQNASKAWMLGILVVFSIVVIGISFLEKSKKIGKA